MSYPKVEAAFAEATKRLQPAVPLLNQSNAELIANWVRNRPGTSLENPSDILAAIQHLHGLEMFVWKVPPAPGALDALFALTPAQLKAQQQAKVAKMLQEQNTKATKDAEINRDPSKAKDPKEVKREAEVTKINRDIQTLIDNYSINLGPGRTSKPDSHRNYLASIKVNGVDGKYSPELTLRCVKAAYFSGDTVAGMRVAVEKELIKINEGEYGSRVTAVGNLLRYNY